MEIKAVSPQPGKEFAEWVTCLGKADIADANSANTTVKLSRERVEVGATYRDVSRPTWSLTVKGGCSGTGRYLPGAIVHIGADKAPEGQLFSKWNIESGSPSIANVNLDNTTLTMPATACVVAATYEAAPAEKYWLEVANGSGGNRWHDAGSQVEIVAAAPPQGQVFDKWVVHYGNAVLADAHSTKTTFAMPKTRTRITATFKPAQ